MDLIERYQALVTHFVTQQATADALCCSQPSVNGWVTGKTKMSAILAIRAENKTNGAFKAIDLCPDLAHEAAS